MSPTSQSILSDAETMDMLIAFYSEALEFLKVPSEQWAEVKMGVSFNNADGKANIISIDYAKRKILVCLQVLKLFTQAINNNSGDAPSFYRSTGYKLARIWQQYLMSGKRCIYETDKDSFDFAMALGILKGLPQIDVPAKGSMIKTLGFNPVDRDAALQMLRNEFGIDCCIRYGYDLSNKEQRLFVTLTDKESLQRGRELLALREESNKRPLAIIEDGKPGSKSNPFINVDEAASYILKIEKERLDTDPYRQTIATEQYFFDYEHGYFRIPWASSNVSYYPLHGSADPCFVVNQLSQCPGHYHEMPRFSIKPSLAHNKFLFRGQSEFFEPCVPNLFRDKEKVAKHQYVDDIIQITELEVLLRQHPLV